MSSFLTYYLSQESMWMDIYSFKELSITEIVLKKKAHLTTFGMPGVNAFLVFDNATTAWVRV